MPTLAIVSFRLGAADGVSTEAEKWRRALESLGLTVTTVAGEGVADRLVPGLGLTAHEAPEREELAKALGDADVVVVENACSLPMNPAATDVLTDVLRGRRAILRHHDLPWQRDRFADFDGIPPDDPRWLHVTINELSRGELAARGITATTIPNTFDTDAAAGDRDRARAAVGVAADETLLVQPTRTIGRKNVAAGVALADALGATYWLLGPTEEDYDDELSHILDGAAGRTIFGRPPDLAIADVYAASDAVVLPSTWEGFGNATVESAIHRRPLAIHPYPVAREIAAYGFRWFPVHDPEPLRAWLKAPDDTVLELNHAIAARHFSLEKLRDALKSLLAGAGWLE
jgi:glycosyltransferase involved in cell wall biosynthesis